MHTLTGHKGAIRALAYASGSTLLASAGDDRTVRLWDLHSRVESGQLEGRDSLLSLAFAPDGGRLAVGGRAGTVAVWDVVKLQRDPGATQVPGPAACLAFSRDGRALLAGVRALAFSPGQLLCWNLNPVHPIEPMNWAADIETAAFCAARDTFAIASPHRGVELWEIGRPRQEPLFWMPGRVRALTFSPGEGKLLAVAGGKSVGVWDVDERRWRAQCHGHKGDIPALAFSPDGRAVLTGGMDRSVRLWEAHSGRQLAAWDWQLGIVNALAYAPDGMTAAAAGDKPTVVVWDVDEG